MTAQKKLAYMHKYYNTTEGRKCSGCCNCHPVARTVSSHCCIAYDHEGDDWNPDGKACGLYSQPFLGIRPRLRELHELVENRQDVEEDVFEQTLFSPTGEPDRRERRAGIGPSHN